MLDHVDRSLGDVGEISDRGGDDIQRRLKWPCLHDGVTNAKCPGVFHQAGLTCFTKGFSAEAVWMHLAEIHSLRKAGNNSATDDL